MAKIMKTLLVVLVIVMFPTGIRAEGKDSLKENRDEQTVTQNPISHAMSDAFSFLIQRGGEKDKPLTARDVSSYPLDLSDTLYIKINRDILASFASDTTASASELISIESQLKALKDALVSIEELSVIARDIAIKRKALLEEERPADKDYKELVKKYEIKWHDTKKSIQAYLEAILPTEQKPEAEKQLSELIRDASNIKLGDFIRTEISRLSSDTSRALSHAVEESPLRLRLRAMVLRSSNGGTPVHLDGYDDGKAGEYQFRDKLSFIQSAERQKRIDQSLEIAGEVKRAIDNSLKNKDDVIKTLGAVYRPLLSAGATLPDPDKIQDRVIKLKEKTDLLLMKLKNKTELNSLSSIIVDINGLTKIFNDQQLSSSFKELAIKIRSLREPTSERELLTTVRTIIESDIGKALSDTGSIITKLKQTVNEFENKIKDLKENIEMIDSIKEEEVASLARDVSGLLEDLLASSKQLLDVAHLLSQSREKGINELSQAAGLLSGVEGGQWNTYAVALRNARDSSIDMNTVSGEEGDSLVFSAELLKHDKATGQDDRINSASTRFSIGSLGWSAHVSGDLLFVRRRGTDRFVTATGISYVFRYRPWSEETSGKKFWSVLNPGFGLNIAALNFPGDAVQVGIGGTLNLLQGLINIGGGYNLQAENDRGYFFIGIGFTGLIDALKLPR